jgi:hypothetical protein
VLSTDILISEWSRVLRSHTHFLAAGRVPRRTTALGLRTKVRFSSCLASACVHLAGRFRGASSRLDDFDA